MTEFEINELKEIVWEQINLFYKWGVLFFLFAGFFLLYFVFKHSSFWLGALIIYQALTGAYNITRAEDLKKLVTKEKLTNEDLAKLVSIYFKL